MSNDTDPLMLWKQQQHGFPHLTRMTRQYLTVSVSSVSPERLFSSVGIVGHGGQSTCVDIGSDQYRQVFGQGSQPVSGSDPV